MNGSNISIRKFSSGIALVADIKMIYINGSTRIIPNEVFIIPYALKARKFTMSRIACRGLTSWGVHYLKQYQTN